METRRCRSTQQPSIPEEAWTSRFRPGRPTRRSLSTWATFERCSTSTSQALTQASCMLTRSISARTGRSSTTTDGEERIVLVGVTTDLIVGLLRHAAPPCARVEWLLPGVAGGATLSYSHLAAADPASVRRIARNLACQGARYCRRQCPLPPGRCLSSPDRPGSSRAFCRVSNDD